MTARSRERGSHAGRPRTYGLPFSVPGLSVRGTSVSFRNGGRSSSAAAAPAVTPEAPAVPGGLAEPGGGPDSWPGAPGPGPGPADGWPLPGEAAVPRTAPPPNGALPPHGARRSGGAARGRGSRHRKPSARRPLLSGKRRMAAVLVVVIGALSAGFADGFGGAGSAVSTVQSFLLDWEQGSYAQAAALTDGGAGQVHTELEAAYTDLDATSAFFAMEGVTQHGDTAVADLQGHGGPGPGGAAVVLHRAVRTDFQERAVGRQLGAWRHQSAPWRRETGSPW